MDTMRDFLRVPVREPHAAMRRRVADRFGIGRPVHAVVLLAERHPDHTDRRVRTGIHVRVRLRVGDLMVEGWVVVEVWQTRNRDNVQGFVGSTMVFHADIIGMSLSRQQEA